MRLSIVRAIEQLELQSVSRLLGFHSTNQILHTIYLRWGNGASVENVILAGRYIFTNPER